MSEVTVFELFQKVNGEELYKDIGKNILILRKQKNLTQLQIAKKLNVTPQQVQKYENGKGSMYVHTLLDISKILGTTPQKMLEKDAGGMQTNIKLSQKGGMRDSGKKADEILKDIDKK